MPPLPSDAAPRPPEDFAPLLATQEPVLLVGGQAVNLWALYYEHRTVEMAPFVSRGVDVPRGSRDFGSAWESSGDSAANLIDSPTHQRTGRRDH